MDNTNFCAWWENTSRVPFNSMHLVSERLAALSQSTTQNSYRSKQKSDFGPEDSGGIANEFFFISWFVLCKCELLHAI